MFARVCVNICHLDVGSHGGQQVTSEPLELEAQVLGVIQCRCWAQNLGPLKSRRCPIHRAISSGLLKALKKKTPEVYHFLGLSLSSLDFTPMADEEAGALKAGLPNSSPAGWWTMSLELKLCLHLVHSSLQPPGSGKR